MGIKALPNPKTRTEPATGSGSRSVVRTMSAEDWGKVREAFVTRATQPTYADLAQEFVISERAVSTASIHQGWPMLRAQRMEQKLREANAGEIVLKAIGASRAVVTAGENVCLVLIHQIGKLAAEITEEDNGATSTRINLANTLSFALSNVASAAKGFGITGLPKGLGDGGAANSMNGTWRPEIVNQINVTLGNLKKAADGAQPVEITASDLI
jgi:hypothetical protein